MSSRQHRRPLSGGTGVNGGAGSGGYSTGSVASRDGTVIGCRQVGQGPGIIAVHGGMQAAQNLMKLAHALADSFTVHGEPEPARQLDAVPRLAGPTSTATEPGARPSSATRSNSKPGPRGARLWSSASAKASYSAKADP